MGAYAVKCNTPVCKIVPSTFKHMHMQLLECTIDNCIPIPSEIQRPVLPAPHQESVQYKPFPIVCFSWPLKNLSNSFRILPTHRPRHLLSARVPHSIEAMF